MLPRYEYSRGLLLWNQAAFSGVVVNKDAAMISLIVRAYGCL